jgi:hypothetical protein
MRPSSRIVLAASAAARIYHQDIERALVGHHLADRRLIGAVGAQGLAAKLLGECLRGIVGAGIGEGDVSAIRGEAADDSGADPAAAAEDERVLSR